MRSLIGVVKSSLGVFGLLTSMYWAMLNAKFGLTGWLFGQRALDWVNARLSTFGDWLPYIVFTFSFSFGVLWLVTSIRDARRKHRNSKVLTRQEAIEQVRTAIDKLKEIVDSLK